MTEDLNKAQRAGLDYAGRRIARFEERNREGWLYNNNYDPDIEEWSAVVRAAESGNFIPLANLIGRDGRFDGKPGLVKLETKLRGTI